MSFSIDTGIVHKYEMSSRSVLLGITGYLLRSSSSASPITLLGPTRKCCLIGLVNQVGDVQRRSYTRKTSVPLMGLGRAVTRKDKNYRNKKVRTNRKSFARADTLDLNVIDWSDVYEAAQSYNPAVVPLPIRMGRPRANKTGDIPPNDKGNIELLKIPNFFHLTPPAIKKHCEALIDYCVPWPTDAKNRVIRITTINHLYSGPSIRHPDSKKVKLQVYLKDLELDDHAKRKLILLVGDRYNQANEELTIITDSCPTRQQNKDYAYYLLTALYHEAWKTEEWESEANGKSDEQLKREIDEVNAELNPQHFEEKKRRRRHYKVVGEKVVRFNNVGHPFVYELRKYGITGGLTPDETQLAKDEWRKLQKDLPDTSTFDAIYHRSSESEFRQN